MTTGPESHSPTETSDQTIGTDAAPAGSPTHDSSHRSSALSLWLRDIVIASAASLFMILFLYQPVRVEGTSMLPRLEDRDRLFINKFVYHFTSISRGDVVVFRYPRDPQLSYIKRVIALPGDRIRI